jgi:Bifunctional DNA primase/polymerase, N-terminal
MTQTALDTQLLEAALAALRDGVSVIPINPDTKRPYGRLLPDELDERGQVVIDPQTRRPKKTWKPYQERYATEDEIRTWHAAGAQFAFVGGEISGGLECIDHDDVGGRVLFDAWRADVDDLADGLPTQLTGGGGYQVAYRYPVPEGAERDGNQKLAWLADNTQDTGRNETTIRNAHLLQAMRGQDAQRRPLSESADGEWALPHARWGKPAR